MSRSRKDSRRITVNGVVYRYTITPGDGYIYLIVGLDKVRGQKLRVNFGYHDEWVSVGGDAKTSSGHRLILPRVVRLAILEGIRQGWKPVESRPGEFLLTGGDGLLPSDEWPRTSATS